MRAEVRNESIDTFAERNKYKLSTFRTLQRSILLSTDSAARIGCPVDACVYLLAVFLCAFHCHGEGRWFACVLTMRW